MYTKFYDDTVVTRFIKYLLSDTYTPLIKVWKEGSFASPSFSYINENKIIRLRNETSSSDHTLSDFDCVGFYDPTKYSRGINSKFVSNNISYDSSTHKWLGKYLRFVRDYYNIDLMPFYNCFCGEFIKNVDINQSGDLVSSTVDDGHKIFIVPIDIDQVYTLCIDEACGVEFTYGFYTPKGLVYVYPNDSEEDVFKGVYNKLTSCSFSTPVIINKVTDVISNAKKLQYISLYEKYLHLFIKIPKSNNSSIVVLEKDIRNPSVEGLTCNSKKVTGEPIPERVKNNSSNYNLYPLQLSPLGLLQWNDHNTYAFSNRLIEYLLSSVITSNETIIGNIELVQRKLPPNISFVPGVWNDAMKDNFYSQRMSSVTSIKGKPSVDYNGFIDKDTEYLLGGNK